MSVWGNGSGLARRQSCVNAVMVAFVRRRITKVANGVARSGTEARKTRTPNYT